MKNQPFFAALIGSLMLLPGVMLLASAQKATIRRAYVIIYGGTSAAITAAVQ
ncbi:MAG: hypothetical protein H7319_10025 [Spirosoma sp.]|nr:hypothetical protein [Spirosoma sp.]